jgi:calcineurin-like phosphoesterase family protein
MIWFTSDTHFDHAKIIELENRPFKDVEEMEDVLVHNWNRRVAKGDLIYHIGDFALTPDRKRPARVKVEKILKRLNGCKQLICGNHDSAAVKKAKGWSWVGDYKAPTIHGQRFVLFHYCIRSWWHNYKGAIHLFGHSHGNLDVTGCGKCMDVGCMNHDWTPISVEDVIERMKNIPVETVDHHDQTCIGGSEYKTGN